jgi:hypothetical protein
MSRGTQWIGYLMGPRAGMDSLEKRQISCLLPEFEPQFFGRPSLSLVAITVTLGQLSIVISTSFCFVASLELCLQQRKSVYVVRWLEKGLRSVLLPGCTRKVRETRTRIKLDFFLHCTRPSGNVFSHSVPQIHRLWVFSRHLKLFVICKVLYCSVAWKTRYKTSCNFIYRIYVPPSTLKTACQTFIQREESKNLSGWEKCIRKWTLLKRWSEKHVTSLKKNTNAVHSLTSWNELIHYCINVKFFFCFFFFFFFFFFFYYYY